MSAKIRVKPRFFFVLLLVVAAIGAYVFMTVDQNNNVRATQELNQQNAQQESDNAEMQRKIEFAQTDEYAEQQARALFGYAKEGETAYVLEDD